MRVFMLSLEPSGVLRGVGRVLEPSIIFLLLPFLLLIMPVGGRVSGKIGFIHNNYQGRSYTGINEEIIWVSIGMGITIAVLISIALCYIMREKCQRRREYYITA